ncbi:hypothetical protein PG984_009006 [Apiospora sp. TS-2023a]
MSSNLGLSKREHTLSNSAAEFLETRGEIAMGADVAETSPEFVPELDRFVAKNDVPDLHYYEKSREKFEQFQQTLTAFRQNLIDRKVDTRFGIAIKDVQEYTFQDVLQIANTVQQRNKNLDNVHKCTKGVKSFFRTVGRNASTFKKLLAFAPNDIYGSALERSESLRDKMYNTLEKIPLTLIRLDKRLEVNYKSASLKFHADAVLVSVFVLLELIVRELSGSTSKKIFKVPFKGDTYGANIEEAMTALEDSVREFEKEAQVCIEKRMGEMDSKLDCIIGFLKRLDADHVSVGEKFASAEKKLAMDEKVLGRTESVLSRLEESLGKQLTTEAHGVQVHNEFYCFLTSSPIFNSRTGSRRPSVPRDWSKPSAKIHRTVVRDLYECFQDMGCKPSTAEQGRIAFILVSEEVRLFLRSTRSTLLVLEELQCDGNQYLTPASYASTVLVRSVQKAKTFPILYHFCVPRASDPDPKNRSLLMGGRGMLASLSSQLLAHLKHIHGVDLEFLSKKRNMFKNATDDPSRLLRILRKLLKCVPKPACIYIIVDAIWKLQNETDQDVLDGLLGLVNDEELFIKILVTSPSSSDILDPLQKEEAKQQKRVKRNDSAAVLDSSLLTLHVPEYVDGGHHDFNTSWVEEEMDDVIRECQSSSQDSSDFEVGSDSNNSAISV